MTRRSITRRVLATLAAALLAACRADQEVPSGDSDPAALWTIVSTCIDRAAARYCACPAFARSCCGDAATPDADVVWARAAGFVAIRDVAMCECPAGFVAGLALPRARVTGIEDPRRPEGIWPFAWDVARSRIPDERQIGLVINPADARTQNQMHVHLLRLRPETRAWLDAADGASPAEVQLAPLPTLDAVFAAVEARVGASAIADTGILVVRARAGGWRAVITRRTSPQAFTLNGCSPDRAPRS
jgi:CDP-diacylglycerol pyrophosphatase